jgi:hypothetical protein
MNRIKMNVARNMGEVFICLHQDRLESALKKMP